EGEDLLTRPEVPDLHGLIHPRCCKTLTVWTEYRVEDPGGMATHGPDVLAGVGIPDPNLAVDSGGRISGGRNKPSAVMAEGHAQDRCAMPRQGKLFLARARIPDSHGLIIAGRGQRFPIRTVSQAPNNAGM